MESINGTIMVSIVLSPYGPEPPVESRWTALVIRCPESSLENRPAHCRSEPVVVKFVPDLEA